MGLLQWLADMSFVKEKEGLQLGSLDKRYREPKYDPHEGFDYERKPREQKTSFEEMQAAKIPYKHRDYCSHLYLDFEACRKRNFPAGWRCHHEKHALDMCKYDDHVLRMREFEREKRIEEKRARADMGQA